MIHDTVPTIICSQQYNFFLIMVAVCSNMKQASAHLIIIDIPVL